MTDPASPDLPVELGHDDRLDSWKEIAAYMKRDVTTVQRWEKREGMPVHRHVHDKMGSVYAYRSELDGWARGRSLAIAQEGVDLQSIDGVTPQTRATTPAGRRSWVWPFAATGALIAVVFTVWQLQRGSSWIDRLAEARFQHLTDFGGTEQSAAISRDGRFVAFLSDRDGRLDVWVTQIGTGQFYNLTRSSDREFANPSIRALGFSPDASLVTFWSRRPDGSGPPDIGVWTAPVLGGQPRPYLEGVAEFDWSGDGARLVYHTPGPGDPMYVRRSGPPAEERQIFAAPEGLHSHFVLWAPDQSFIYFVQGRVPDRMDIWRIRPSGGAAERMTTHDSVVSYPVFVDEDTLIYLASDPDGSGPRLHSLDVRRRLSRRVSSGIDRYTSLAASGDGRRLVASLARLTGTLWRLSISGGVAGTSDAHRISLTTGNGSAPRLGADYLLYVSSKGATDSIWKLRGEAATELWSGPDTRIVGGPAIARDGRRIAFSARHNGRTLLYMANTDGTEARVVTQSLELQGAPAWTPDGQSITVAAVTAGVPHLFTVPLDGRPPTPFVTDYSVDPTWSPDGDVVVFSGADVGTTFPVKAVTANASTYRLANLMLTRGARRLAFMPGRRSLVVLRGGMRHRNLWMIDLETGVERQLTDFARDFEVRDFDISADGREIVLEQVQEHSDIVLVDVP